MEIYAPSNVRIQHNGKHEWVTLALVKATCRVQVYSFPFDTQVCNLTFGSWAFDLDKLLLSSEIDYVNLESYIENGEWTIRDAPVTSVFKYYPASRSNWSEVVLTLVLERRPLYYAVNLVLPCVLLLCVGLMSFCLSAESGEKIVLTTTVLLTMMLFQTMVADKLPTTSDDIPLFTAFFACAVLLLVAATGAAVVVAGLSMRGDQGRPVPASWYSVLTGRLSSLLCLRYSANKVLKEHVPGPTSSAVITNNIVNEGRPDEDFKTQNNEAAANPIINRNLLPNGLNNLNQVADEACDQEAPNKNIPNTQNTGKAMVNVNGNIWTPVQEEEGENRSQKWHLEDEAAKLYVENQARKRQLYQRKAEWRLAAKMVDRVFLIIFLVAILTVTVTLFVMAAIP